MSVTVNADLLSAEVNQALHNMRGKFPRVMARSVERAAQAARTEMTKKIGEDTALPAKRIKDEIKLDKVGDNTINMRVQGRRIPLIDFRARGLEPSRGRGNGVAYRLPGGRGRDPKAFIATMPSGHRGVFKRAETSRNPIFELFGPSLVKVFEKFLPAGAERAREALYKNLRSEISYALRRK